MSATSGSTGRPRGRPFGRYDYGRDYFRTRYGEVAIQEVPMYAPRRPPESVYADRLGLDPRTLRRYRVVYEVPLGSTGVG